MSCEWEVERMKEENQSGEDKGLPEPGDSDAREHI